MACNYVITSRKSFWISRLTQQSKMIFSFQHSNNSGRKYTIKSTHG
nr:unnamed protein product [Callosobruchus analis]